MILKLTVVLVTDYRRASKNQEKYIADMCQQLGILNEALYSKFTVERAGKYIEKLQRMIEKRDIIARQQKLL